MSNLGESARWEGASLGARLVALFIDNLCTGITIMFVRTVLEMLGWLLGLSGIAYSAGALLTAGLIGFSYFTEYPVWFGGGATLGHQVAGLVVISETSGDLADSAHLRLRGLLRIVYVYVLWPFAIAGTVGFPGFGKRASSLPGLNQLTGLSNRYIHDRVAGTTIVVGKLGEAPQAPGAISKSAFVFAGMAAITFLVSLVGGYATGGTSPSTGSFTLEVIPKSMTQHGHCVWTDKRKRPFMADDDMNGGILAVVSGASVRFEQAGSQTGHYTAMVGGMPLSLTIKTISEKSGEDSFWTVDQVTLSNGDESSSMTLDGTCGS